MASSRNLVSTIGALASPKWGTEPEKRRKIKSAQVYCKLKNLTKYMYVQITPD